MNPVVLGQRLVWWLLFRDDTVLLHFPLVLWP
jgi:hypothetical protein